MVINCCLAPSTALVCDDNFERRKRKKEKSKKSKSLLRKSQEEKAIKGKKRTQKKVEKEEYSERQYEETEDSEATNSSSASSTDPETKMKDKTVFRGSEALSVKSDPPASLSKSLLADSFYSDDSLDNGDLTFEVDYNTSTPLFEALEQNDWGNVLFFLRAGKFMQGSQLKNEKTMDKPETQVRTWVYCHDEAGEMMWRQLPLHAAICLGAPLVVIQRIAELYPDALACPDSYGNLPLNLAAKLHGTESYTFQVVSARSQRWLQARQDSDDDHDESTVETRERDIAHQDSSFDQPQAPKMFSIPHSPVHLQNRTQVKKGRTPTRAFVDRLAASYEGTFSSSLDEDDDDTEYGT